MTIRMVKLISFQMFTQLVAGTAVELIDTGGVLWELALHEAGGFAASLVRDKPKVGVTGMYTGYDQIFTNGMRIVE
jgi:hypothetical protein